MADTHTHAGKPSAPPVDALPMATALPIVSPSTPQQVHIHIETPRAPTSNGWKSGVCGCTDNCCNCWMALCCPCVTFGQISERVNHNGCCGDCGCCGSGFVFGLVAWIGCAGLMTCMLRQKVAAASGIPSNCCDDFCISFCCTHCALCQMANQLDIQKDGCSFAAPPPLETMQR